MNKHNDEFLKVLGEAISRRRKRLKLSQLELSERCFVDRSYLSQLELGRRNPSIEMFNRLAVGLRVKPSRLLALCERSHESVNS